MTRVLTRLQLLQALRAREQARHQRVHCQYRIWTCIVVVLITLLELALLLRHA